METGFLVYDIKNNMSITMTFKDLCKKYPEVDLNILNEKCINIISIYNKGEKIAIINRIKER